MRPFHACVAGSIFLTSASAALAISVATGPFYIRFGAGADPNDRAFVLEIIKNGFGLNRDHAVYLCSTPSSSPNGAQHRKLISQSLIDKGIPKSRIYDGADCIETDMGRALGEAPRDAVLVTLGIEKYIKDHLAGRARS